MTPQEQQLLKGLADRVNGTQLTDKDPDAEQFIFQQLGKNSDSLYIMAQTILVQQYALDNARKQLDEQKQQLDQAHQQAQQNAQQPVKLTSFLGSLLGTDEPSRPAPPPPPQAQYQPVQTYALPVGYAQPASYGAPMMAGGVMGGGMMGGGGGFLRSAMTTAAGVAAGAVAFEGIESLMHGFGQHAGYGMGGFGDGGFGGGGQPREEIINNNYYGDSSPAGSGGSEHGRDLSDRFADAGDQPSRDIEDRRDDFADTSSNDDFSDSFVDNSSSDDFSGSDDSGSSSSDDSGF